MSALLDDLRASIAAALEARAKYQDELDAIVASAEARSDKNLTEAESEKFSELRSTLIKTDAELAEAAQRADALADDEVRAKNAADLAAKFPTAPAAPTGGAVVTRGERTYNPDDARNGQSFMADVIAKFIDNDFGAGQRLDQHMQEERIENRAPQQRESRATNTGAFAGLTVPQYLTDMVAPLARAMRPLVDICNMHPLPSTGMTVNISRITTGTSADVQSSENSAVSETDADDTLLTVNINTIAGQQTISRQAIDRSIGADAITLQDLQRAYWTKLDSQLLNGSGSAGQHQGLDTLTGRIDVTYNDGSPTILEAYPNIFNLISQVQSGVFMGVNALLMAPRRFWWFANAVGTSFPFMQILPGAVQQMPGRVDTDGYGQGPSGVLAGLPVYVDGNVSLTSGAGAEDRIWGVTTDELHLWMDSSAPLLIRAEQTKAANLGVLLVLYGYSAFTAGRYPGAHGNIRGTGLTTPTFVGS
jgi:HK97 family phage major capsid protein